MINKLSKLLLKGILVSAVSICAMFSFFASANSQQSITIETPRGIIFGNGWNHETRELNIVFEDQSTLDLGVEGVRDVQFWVEIRNNKGNNITWVIEYASGLRQEIWTQQIRYDRFRTYMSKTFRRNIWDAESKQNMDVSGPCKVILMDMDRNNRVIAEKNFILK